MLSFLMRRLLVASLKKRVDAVERSIEILARSRRPERRMVIVGGSTIINCTGARAAEIAAALALDLGADVAIAEVVDIIPAHGLVREAS